MSWSPCSATLCSAAAAARATHRSAAVSRFARRSAASPWRCPGRSSAARIRWRPSASASWHCSFSGSCVLRPRAAQPRTDRCNYIRESAMLLPRSVALAVAAAVAIVSVGVTGVTGTALIINGLTHLLMYGYAALLTSNWEQERRRLMRMSRVDELTGLRNLRALQEQLPTWLGPAARTGRRMAVMMMDVGGFERVT